MVSDQVLVASVAMAAGAAVTITNIVVNGDGVSVTALFALIGTIMGYVFGKSQGPSEGQQKQGQ